MRARRALVALVLLGASVGCERPGIDREAARVLQGDWNLVLRARPDPWQRDTTILEIRGTAALLANRSAITVEGFPIPPPVVGVHDLPVERLVRGIRPGDVTVAASLARDSILLIVGPKSLVPIRLTARYRPDSIAGVWVANQWAGVMAVGTFLLTRRRDRA